MSISLNDPNPFKVGQKFRLFIVRHIYKIHIVAIVEEDMVVFRYYGKHRQWWHYKVKSAYDLDFQIELTKEKYEGKVK